MAKARVSASRTSSSEPRDMHAGHPAAFHFPPSARSICAVSCSSNPSFAWPPSHGMPSGSHSHAAPPEWRCRDAAQIASAYRHTCPTAWRTIHVACRCRSASPAPSRRCGAWSASRSGQQHVPFLEEHAEPARDAVERHRHVGPRRMRQPSPPPRCGYSSAPPASAAAYCALAIATAAPRWVRHFMM